LDPATWTLSLKPYIPLARWLNTYDTVSAVWDEEQLRLAPNTVTQDDETHKHCNPRP